MIQQVRTCDAPCDPPSELLGVGCIKIDIAIHSFFIHLAADGISILYFIFKKDLIISNDS